MKRLINMLLAAAVAVVAKAGTAEVATQDSVMQAVKVSLGGLTSGGPVSNSPIPELILLPDDAPGEVILPDSLSAVVVTPDEPVEKIGNEPVKHFAWGIDAGSAIDLTGNDMSAIGIGACFGYSGPYLRFAGVGAAIDMMVSSSSSSYPVFAMVRTDLRRQHQLCFLEARGGVAFTNINNYATQTTPYGSLGVGITLATGRTFSSHVLLSYNYTKLNDVAGEEGVMARIHDLQYASIKIGIVF